MYSYEFNATIVGFTHHLIIIFSQHIHAENAFRNIWHMFHGLKLLIHFAFDVKFGNVWFFSYFSTKFHRSLYHVKLNSNRYGHHYYTRDKKKSFPRIIAVLPHNNSCDWNNFCVKNIDIIIRWISHGPSYSRILSISIRLIMTK